MQLRVHLSKVMFMRGRRVPPPPHALLLLAMVMSSCAESAESATQSTQSANGSGVVASVGDTRISDTDLDEWWQRQDGATYLRIRRETYDARRRALDAMLAERVLSAEAAGRGMTVESLLDHEVARRAKPVTDADVSAFVSSNPLPAGATPAMVAPLVAVLLGQRARETAKEEYLRTLRMTPAMRVEVFLEPPRVSLPRAPHNPTRGSATAPVEVVVFSDFECPFCRRAEPSLARLIERFPSEVLFVWRHYPLAMHQAARPAAEAAQCAHDQGRFWPFHDALFADPALLPPAGLLTTAERLGLDPEAFAHCVSTRVHADDVAIDTDAGERAGVSGTPTVFINGVAFVGALSYEVYERAVLDALARAAGALRPPVPTSQLEKP
jgi:protein-disulfide isomerase